MAAFRVVIHHAVAAVENQLQEGVRVGILGAGSHLHGEQEEKNEAT